MQRTRRLLFIQTRRRKGHHDRTPVADSAYRYYIVVCRCHGACSWHAVASKGRSPAILESVSKQQAIRRECGLSRMPASWKRTCAHKLSGAVHIAQGTVAVLVLDGYVKCLWLPSSRINVVQCIRKVASKPRSTKGCQSGSPKPHRTTPWASAVPFYSTQAFIHRLRPSSAQHSLVLSLLLSSPG